MSHSLGLRLTRETGLPEASVARTFSTFAAKPRTWYRAFHTGMLRVTARLAWGNRILICARRRALSASETKYSVGCGWALTGDEQVTCVAAYKPGPDAANK